MLDLVLVFSVDVPHLNVVVRVLRDDLEVVVVVVVARASELNVVVVVVGTIIVVCCAGGVAGVKASTTVVAVVVSICTCACVDSAAVSLLPVLASSFAFPASSTPT